VAKNIGKVLPKICYHNNEYIELYTTTWNYVKESWKNGTTANKLQSKYFNYSHNTTINQFEACLSTFFLAYCNKIYPVIPLLDNFYSKQEESGAIRGIYNEKDGKPVFSKNNPECVFPPLFAWAEYNLYHKLGYKKRVKEIMPVLEKYYTWLETNFRHQNGLYSVPLAATTMDNAPREEMAYPIDFNTQQAINALYMSALGEIMNDKEKNYRYKKHYFSLKTRINNLMWNEEDGYYYDLDKKGRQIRNKTIASYWPLFAEIPNRERSERMVTNLLDSGEFGIERPFPSISQKNRVFSKLGMGYRGSVYPQYAFVIVKGLEKYGKFDLAREVAINHLNHLVEESRLKDVHHGSLWEAYSPVSAEPARWPRKGGVFPKPYYLPYIGLSTIALMIENILGFYISLPRKTIDWIIPKLEVMGIEDLSLKRNMIKIMSNQSGRGWEIRLESEKLYYFTINILGTKKRTLPIPSGKCSILLDKL
jgi:neutral trehalase